MLKFSPIGPELTGSTLNHLHPEVALQGALAAFGQVTPKQILDVGITGGGQHPSPVSFASFLIIAQGLLFAYLPS